MAGCHFDGVDWFTATFDQLSQLEPEDMLSVLRPAATLLQEEFQQTIQNTFRQRTGALRESIQLTEKTDEGFAAIYVGPKGKHPGSSTGRRWSKRRGKRRSNGHYSGTNAEVGYILEEGSDRIDARYWMANTNEQQEDAIAQAEAQAWDALVTEKGL